MIANPVTLPLADYKAQHVRLTVGGKVATLTLNRPDKKNPLTSRATPRSQTSFAPPRRIRP